MTERITEQTSERLDEMRDGRTDDWSAERIGERIGQRIDERAAERATAPVTTPLSPRAPAPIAPAPIAPAPIAPAPIAPAPVIVARGLGYAYQSGPLRKDALIDLDLEIARGSCAAIIGVTGSGKSTLVRHFNGLLRPTSGSVTVDGVETRADAADLPALRRRVGMLFQFPETQLFARTVYADVAFGPQRLRLERREVRARVHDALTLVGLPPDAFAARSPFDLSGGQRRRVALAGVLAMMPTVLILDEPAVGLDAAGRADMYAILRHVRAERDATIILVSHDMAEVAALADTVSVLHEGRLVLHGPPRAIFARTDELAACGLAPPPLVELLALLRARGLDVPIDALTLDAAFVAIRRAYGHPRGGCDPLAAGPLAAGPLAAGPLASNAVAADAAGMADGNDAHG